jgi:hypothetical protein
VSADARRLVDHPCFRGAPDVGKMARDGRWEEAVTFAPGDLLVEAQVRELLHGAQDVACEAFFGEAFFGMRFLGADPAPSVTAFARALTLPDFFAALPEVPLAQRFEFAEIGAEGAWNSVGPYRLDDLHPSDDLWADLQEASVWADTAHEKALEFSFANGDGSTHWFAFPVSRDRRIERTMMEDALRFGAGAVSRAGHHDHP